MKKDKNKKHAVIEVPSDDNDDDDDDSYEEEPPPKKSKDRKPITVACKIRIMCLMNFLKHFYLICSDLYNENIMFDVYFLLHLNL